RLSQTQVTCKRPLRRWRSPGDRAWHQGFEKEEPLVRRSLTITTLLAALSWVAAPPTGAGAALQSRSAHTPALMLTGDGLSRAVRTGRIAPARAALLRAEALFHPRLAADQAGVTISSAKGDATMILRDLALRQGDLSPADRVRAQRILARPSDGAGDPIGY